MSNLRHLAQCDNSSSNNEQGVWTNSRVCMTHIVCWFVLNVGTNRKACSRLDRGAWLRGTWIPSPRFWTHLSCLQQSVDTERATQNIKVSHGSISLLVHRVRVHPRQNRSELPTATASDLWVTASARQRVVGCIQDWPTRSLAKIGPLYFGPLLPGTPFLGPPSSPATTISLNSFSWITPSSERSILGFTLEISALRTTPLRTATLLGLHLSGHHLSGLLPAWAPTFLVWGPHPPGAALFLGPTFLGRTLRALTF